MLFSLFYWYVFDIHVDVDIDICRGAIKLYVPKKQVAAGTLLEALLLLEQQGHATKVIHARKLAYNFISTFQKILWRGRSPAGGLWGPSEWRRLIFNHHAFQVLSLSDIKIADMCSRLIIN